MAGIGGRTRTSGQGRPKGIPNKVTGDLRAMILAALDAAGGAEYLRRQSEASPAAFMTLVGKVLPTTITGPPAGEGTPVSIEVNLVRAKDSKPE